ncbi:MAG: D-alanyl-D-alanine carboxypeptidase/D-alanyl-D-alanine-endopeptidase, partial [Bacteroidales bacterium]|nr:D-alanyl-D-alanine carboxypeptidase/D-alanyl-D-alanine-endopeptidase [Bacteroidales bacterium]
ASIFDKQYLPDTWQWGDIGNYYASGVSGLNFHENMFFVYFNAGGRIGYPATLDGTLPYNLDVNLQNEVITGGEKSGDQVVVYGEPSSSIRMCRGTVPLGSSHFGIRAAMPRPAETCAKLFVTYLRNHGSNVSGDTEEVFAVPKEMKVALKYCSNPFYVIAQYTNQTSNNTYAECIYKYLGYQRFGLGSFQNGEKAVKEYFHSLGLETGGVHMVDGSGLSRENRATADFMCRFLEKVSQEDYFDQFQQTFGVVGKSGTVRMMNMELPAKVTVHVKSGSMQGICSFAGYVERGDGFQYAFSILCNGYDGSGANARAKLQDIIREIAML